MWYDQIARLKLSLNKYRDSPASFEKHRDTKNLLFSICCIKKIVFVPQLTQISIIRYFLKILIYT